MDANSWPTSGVASTAPAAVLSLTDAADAVVAWSDRVRKPRRLRYAYAPKRQSANLFNKDGLPGFIGPIV